TPGSASGGRPCTEALRPPTAPRPAGVVRRGGWLLGGVCALVIAVSGPVSPGHALPAGPPEPSGGRLAGNGPGEGRAHPGRVVPLNGLGNGSATSVRPGDPTGPDRPPDHERPAPSEHGDAARPDPDHEPGRDPADQTDPDTGPDPDQGTDHGTGHDEGHADGRDPGDPNDPDGDADEGDSDANDGDAGDGDASAAPSDGRSSPDASAAPSTGRDAASTAPPGSASSAPGDASVGPVPPEGRPPWGGSRDHAEAGRPPYGYGWGLPGHPPVPLLPSGEADGTGGGGRPAGAGSGTAPDGATGGESAAEPGDRVMRVLPLGTGMALTGLGLAYFGLRLRRR
uniref:hypothetical protein n=1 Tax=Streptomyces buecherae TaxID=2763006 RepID=UPI001C27274C